MTKPNAEKKAQELADIVREEAAAIQSIEKQYRSKKARAARALLDYFRTEGVTIDADADIGPEFQRRFTAEVGKWDGPYGPVECARWVLRHIDGVQVPPGGLEDDDGDMEDLLRKGAERRLKGKTSES